eukprot:319057_1
MDKIFSINGGIRNDKNECAIFIETKNDKIINNMFKPNELMNYLLTEPYRGLLKYISAIYSNDNASTNNIKNSIKILFNWSCLNWINKNRFIETSKQIIKYCPLCNVQRCSMNEHIMNDS